MGSSFDKRRLSWALFDFANSVVGTLILTFVYNSYFIARIAKDEAQGTALWGGAVAGSSILVAALSPPLGAAADAFAWKKRLLLASVGLACVFTALLCVPQQGDVGLALLLVTGAIFFTELSIVFNNAFLSEVAPAASHGRLSGQAFALGYVGGLACLFIALFGFIGFGGEGWLGISEEGDLHIRSTTLLAAGWFALFSLPFFAYVKEAKAPRRAIGLGAVAKGSFARMLETFGRLREYKDLFWMLVARLFYNDGLVAVFSFGGVYAMFVFGFSSQDLLLFGIVLNISSALGALAFSFVEDRIGSWMTIAISLLGLIGASSLALFAQSKPAFWACGIAIGVFIGPNQSASRAYLSRSTPIEKSSEFFGFFAFSGKATAFVGPLLYGQIVLLSGSQRLGMALVPTLFGIGLLIFLFKTTNPRRREGRSAANRFERADLRS